MGKVPLQVLKELEHQVGQNLSTINFTATFARTASSCNTAMEKCQHSIKATFQMYKSQIQKGADPKTAVTRGYDNACDYFEIMNKIIFIQQRALACLSKSVPHIPQRELYTMGNTGPLRREAKMTLLQPHLGDSRHQEVRNSRSWPSPLLKYQLVKDGEDFLLSRLNTFVLVERFKMKTPESIRASLIPGEWVSSIDLSNAYLHMLIHPNSRKYLRFCHKSQVFQFTSLPFRLATAPQVFTMNVKEVKLMALSKGIRLHQYLDDWLIRAQT